MKKFAQKTVEEQLYRIGLLALPIALAFGIAFFRLFFQRTGIRCVFLTFTGFYCPGCGGTRAVHALFHGKLLKALWYHPFVVYSVVLYGLFMGSHTLSIFFPKIKGMKYRNGYLYGAAAVILLNFILKNILLKQFGIVLESVEGGLYERFLALF